jgi:hypothetical protein
MLMPKSKKVFEQNKIISLIQVNIELEPVICKVKIQPQNELCPIKPTFLQITGPKTRPTMEGVFSIYKKALGLALGSF